MCHDDMSWRYIAALYHQDMSWWYITETYHHDISLWHVRRQIVVAYHDDTPSRFLLCRYIIVSSQPDVSAWHDIAIHHHDTPGWCVALMYRRNVLWCYDIMIKPAEVRWYHIGMEYRNDTSSWDVIVIVAWTLCLVTALPPGGKLQAPSHHPPENLAFSQWLQATRIRQLSPEAWYP